MYGKVTCYVCGDVCMFVHTCMLRPEVDVEECLPKPLCSLFCESRSRWTWGSLIQQDYLAASIKVTPTSVSYREDSARSRCSGYCGSRLSLWRIWSFLSQRRCSLWNTYLGVECPSSPFFWSNLNDFFLTELSLISLNRFLVQFLFHYFMTLISSNAVSCAQICQLLTSGLDACTVDFLTNSALPSHCCCNSQTSQLAVFKHRAVFEEGPGGLVKTKPMPSLWTFHTTFSNSSKRKPTLTRTSWTFLSSSTD